MCCYFFVLIQKAAKKIKANTKPPAVLPGQRHGTSMLLKNHFTGNTLFQ